MTFLNMPSEFWTGVRYYQGDRSPNAVEREELGYSAAWLHHKGRNKHHFEYWMDFSKASCGIAGCKMPLNYVVEMVMDRIAACKVYRGKEYTDASAWEYYQRERPYLEGAMHPKTKQLLEKILIMLRDKGEKRTLRSFCGGDSTNDRVHKQPWRKELIDGCPFFKAYLEEFFWGTTGVSGKLRGNQPLKISAG